jgi:hypothetical protein
MESKKRMKSIRWWDDKLIITYLLTFEVLEEDNEC